MSSDLRRHPRVPIAVPMMLEAVDESWAREVCSGDVSDGGCFIEMEKPYPGIGDKAYVQTLLTMGDGESPPRRLVEVVRHSTDGVGVMFLDAD